MKKLRLQVRSEWADLDREVRALYDRRFADPRASLAAALPLLEQARAAGYAWGVACALRIAGGANSRLSHLEEAEAQLREAEAILLEIGDEVGLHATRSALGTLHVRRGEYTEAFALYNAAREVFRANGAAVEEADVMAGLGWVHSDLGAYAEAVQVLLEAQAVAERSGDDGCLARVLNNLGCAYGSMGDPGAAEGAFLRGLALARATGETAYEAMLLLNLGVRARTANEPAQALEYLQASERLNRELGLGGSGCYLLLEIGEVHAARGEHRAALEPFGEALERARASGERTVEALALVDAGTALHALGEREAGTRMLEEGLAHAQALGLTACARDAHQVLATAAEEAGDSAAALRHLRAFHEAEMQVQQAAAELRMRQRRVIEDLERARREAEVRLLQSELQVLKAQLQPHFLFNSLNSVAALMHRDPSAATEMLGKLADLLRVALRQSSGEDVTLAQELEFLSLYLDVEQLRRSAALEIRIDVPADLLGARVPHLLLQPLAENALRHGLASRAAGGRLHVTAHRTGDDGLGLTVQDNGVGLPEAWTMANAGVGLSHTRDRLRLMYGSRHFFGVAPVPAGGTRVEIRLPLVRGAAPG